jgi:hypothetical protein
MRDGIVRSQVLKSVGNAIMRALKNSMHSESSDDVFMPSLSTPFKRDKVIKDVMDELSGHIGPAAMETTKRLMENNLGMKNPVRLHMVGVDCTLTFSM